MTPPYTERLKRQPSRRTFLKGAGTAIGVSALSGTGAAQSAQDKHPNHGRGENPNHGPRITAHRGYVGLFPQNTVAAIEGASQFRATDRIEIDVLPCADGEIVVFHDLFLDNLTNEEGMVAETPCETVLQAEVLDTEETIPTLAQVLDAARPSITMNIEFKNSGNLSWEEFAERTLAIASEYPGDFYVSSFHTDALKAVREVDPSVAIGVLFGDNVERNLEVAQELDAEAINPSLGALDRELVEAAHEHGRDVNVYTIDSWLEARRPVELNVDGLIADYPNVLEYF